jgi:ATP-binding cassette subfamily C protein EexD
MGAAFNRGIELLSNTPAPLMEALRVSRRSFIAIGLFSCFINLLMLVPSFYMLQVYDRVISTGSQATLLMLTLIMAALLSCMGALEWVRSRIMVRVSNQLDVQLAPTLYDASFRLALLSGGRKSSAQPLHDMTSLRQFLTGNGLFAFFDAPWIPIYLAVMFAFHPWFGWLGLSCALFLGVLAMVNEIWTRQLLQTANQENLQAAQFTEKNLRNAEVVAAMGMLGDLRQRWCAFNERVLICQSQASDRAGLISAVSKTFRQIMQSLVLGIGAYLVIERNISPGLMIAGSILLGRALAPVDQIIGSWKGVIAARGQYQRLNELLQEIASEPARMPLPAPRGEVQVDSLLLAPPGSQQLTIRNLSFRLPAGSSLAIMGASGAGKSSLARALLGIWPPRSGSVRLDDVDISQWNREELGPHLGYLPQDIELFEGSIAQNIARFGELNPDWVVEAARLAGVHELILQLPEGYDTVIGANGGGLSGGQRQRIALARAVYGNPRFVILDEPNSNLDERGEQMLMQTLQQLHKNGCTTVVISHKSGILQAVERLLVLNAGELVAYGPTSKVLEHLQINRPAAQGLRA